MDNIGCLKVERAEELVENGVISDLKAASIAGINIADWSRISSKEAVTIDEILRSANNSDSRSINMLVSYVHKLRQENEEPKKK